MGVRTSGQGSELDEGEGAEGEDAAVTRPRLEPGLSLYQFHSCPFCARVRHAADELGIGLELRDTLADRDHARAVVEATGRRTVPVLRIEGEDGEVEWLPESADIVRYLRDRFGN